MSWLLECSVLAAGVQERKWPCPGSVHCHSLGQPPCVPVTCATVVVAGEPRGGSRRAQTCPQNWCAWLWRSRALGENSITAVGSLLLLLGALKAVRGLQSPWAQPECAESPKGSAAPLSHHPASSSSSAEGKEHPRLSRSL